MGLVRPATSSGRPWALVQLSRALGQGVVGGGRGVGAAGAAL